MNQARTLEQRKALLAKEVALLVAHGRLIESQSLTSATLKRGRLLTHREVAEIDEWGRFSLTKIPPRRDQILRLVTVGVAAILVVVLIMIRIALG